MSFFFVSQQGERATEFGMKLIGPIADDRQAATLCRAVLRKSGDDDMATGLHSSQNGLHIGGPIFGCRKKVKDGSVVPKGKTMDRQSFLGDIGLEPPDLRSRCSEPTLRFC